MDSNYPAIKDARLQVPAGLYELLEDTLPSPHGALIATGGKKMVKSRDTNWATCNGVVLPEANLAYLFKVCIISERY